jgi:hypothetical protein
MVGLERSIVPPLAEQEFQAWGLFPLFFAAAGMNFERIGRAASGWSRLACGSRPQAQSSSTLQRRSRPGPPYFSRDEADFALVTDGEYSDLVLRYQEAVQRDVTSRAVRNHHFADVAVNASPQQRVCSEVPDRGADRVRGHDCSLGLLGTQEFERALQVIQRAW